MLIPILATFALLTQVQDQGAAVEFFPPTTALAEGLSPKSLQGLSELVQSFVDDGEIVGAELLVIKNKKSVLHQSFGWRDRDGKVAMENGSVFCVRSMTKPVIGAAVLMLVDDRRIKLTDHVAEYLPSFAAESSKDITVEQLLTHTSGLPLSLILGKNLHELDGIRAVAELGAGCELEFEPGTAFNYSDQGTDTLTALIEVVTGAPAADFVRARVLDPLGMLDTTCVMSKDHALRERACVKYGGMPGAWNRFWGPEDEPLFPFFLGSQGLYSTLEDYVRFTELWARGRSRSARLLRTRSARRALTPGPYPLGGPTALPGLQSDYGFLMQLWTGPGEGDEREVIAYGHSGSDGTHAWVFPEQKATVLYFTQSRGTTTGLRVEEALGDLLLGVPYDANQDAPPFEEYLGYYREELEDLYRAVIRDGDDLALEILGKAIVPLSYKGEDRWSFRANPGVVLEFDRSEAGEVTGYHIGDHQEFRFQPAEDLPDIAEVTARAAQAHGMHLLEGLGPIRMVGDLSIEKLGITGHVSSLLAWPDRYRDDVTTGEEWEKQAFDGEHIRYESRTVPLAMLEGAAAELNRIQNPFARFGDLGLWHAKLQVIQVLQGGEAIIVRAGDTSAPAATVFIHAETGMVGRVDSMIHIVKQGRIGTQTKYDDYREVSGMMLPFRVTVSIANPSVGSIAVETLLTEVEVGVELPEGTFELRD